MSLTDKIVADKVEAIIDGIMHWAVDNEYGDCDDCRYSSSSVENSEAWGVRMSHRTYSCEVPENRLCPVVESIAAALYAEVNRKEKKP